MDCAELTDKISKLSSDYREMGRYLDGDKMDEAANLFDRLDAEFEILLIETGVVFQIALNEIAKTDFLLECELRWRDYIESYFTDERIDKAEVFNALMEIIPASKIDFSPSIWLLNRLADYIDNHIEISAMMTRLGKYQEWCLTRRSDYDPRADHNIYYSSTNPLIIQHIFIEVFLNGKRAPKAK